MKFISVGFLALVSSICLGAPASPEVNESAMKLILEHAKTLHLNGDVASRSFTRVTDLIAEGIVDQAALSNACTTSQQGDLPILNCALKIVRAQSITTMNYALYAGYNRGELRATGFYSVEAQVTKTNR